MLTSISLSCKLMGMRFIPKVRLPSLMGARSSQGVFVGRVRDNVEDFVGKMQTLTFVSRSLSRTVSAGKLNALTSGAKWVMAHRSSIFLFLLFACICA